MSSAATTGLQRGRNRLKGMLGKGSVVAGSCSLKCGRAGHAGLHSGLLELKSSIWLNASARKREVLTGDFTPKVLAAAITIGFFGILFWMFVHGVPKNGNEALLLMLGALQTAFTGVIAYYFGSSAGSKAKNELLKGDK